MAKRFTDVEKWRDPWFRRLSPEHKLIWLYLLDGCDWAGVWSVDKELAEVIIGLENVNWQAFLDCCNCDQNRPRIQVLKDGLFWWLTKFCLFQFPDGLSDSCKPHKPVLRSLQKHGLTEQVVAMYRDSYTQQNHLLRGEAFPPSNAESDKSGEVSQTKKSRVAEIVGAFSSAYNAAYASTYEATKADYAQAAKFVANRVNITAARFAEVANACWARGKYKPSSSLTVAGLCSQWDKCYAMIQEASNQPKSNKEYSF